MENGDKMPLSVTNSTLFVNIKSRRLAVVFVTLVGLSISWCKSRVNAVSLSF